MKTGLWLGIVLCGALAAGGLHAGEYGGADASRRGYGGGEAAGAVRTSMNANDGEEEESPYVIAAERRTMDRMRQLYGGPGALARQKAARVHDRVTIVVKDSIDAKNTLKTDFSKDSDTDWALNDFFTVRKENGQWVAVPRGEQAASAAGQTAKTPRFKFTATAGHKTDGKNNVTSSMSTELSGEVMDVLPNGHLIVEARKKQIINGETMAVVFTGRVDPRDLDASSRVEDRYVIDREVRIEGKGVYNDFTKRGLIPKLMDKLNFF